MSEAPKLPLSIYKVFLTQIIEQMLERLESCGIKKGSKRAVLIKEIRMCSNLLAREFKRDVTLQYAKEEKKVLLDEIYEKGRVPEWIFNAIFRSILEESEKTSSSVSEV